MALLFVDGFDAGDFGIKYSLTGGGGFSTSPSTRFGQGLCVQKGPNISGTLAKQIPPSASVILGFAGKYNSNYAAYPAIFASFAGDNGATPHIQIATADTAGYIEVSRGFGGSRTVLFTAAVSVNTWHYFELQVKISATVGYATLKVDGIQVGSFSGNTKNGGTSTNIDNITMHGSSNATGITLQWDDLYVCDETGAAPYNTFLGDIRIATITPNGAGASTQFNSSAGANHTAVDELPYSDTDYISASNSGTRDSYTMSDVAGNYNVLGVQNNVIAKKLDAGGTAVKPAITAGGTTYYGPNKVLASSDTTASGVWATNPATSAAWTLTDVNNLESGVEIA